MIEQLPDPASAAAWCDEIRRQGHTIGFVPTMGALHEGHLSLVQRAVRENDRVCASIFVNPLQFDRPADLEKYPRDFTADVEMLNAAGCHMVFTGKLMQFFPEFKDPAQIPPGTPGPAARGLEGDFRPGHLEGVWRIVERLFRTAGACTAYFGEKDFQQCLVIGELAAAMPGIEIVACPTVREPSGLALSSRNRRLTAAQRDSAVRIYTALCAARDAWSEGERGPEALERRMLDTLADSGLRVEYAAVRDPEDWTPGRPAAPLAQARALVAAWLGEVRLIDNLRLDR